MAVDNSTILDNVWLHATNDYQQRIPNSTQASVAQTMKHLFDPMNARYLLTRALSPMALPCRSWVSSGLSRTTTRMMTRRFTRCTARRLRSGSIP